MQIGGSCMKVQLICSCFRRHNNNNGAISLPRVLYEQQVQHILQTITMKRFAFYYFIILQICSKIQRNINIYNK